MNKLVDCSRVYVDTSLLSTKDNEFYGVFANEDIKNGELVECGLMKRLSDMIIKYLMG